jgi:hypothetical protein
MFLVFYQSQFEDPFMKTLFAMFTFCLALVTFAVAEDTAPKAHPDTTGWMTLFTGDLADADYNKGVWSINKDGELTATKDEAIWTKTQYERFTLDLEFKTDANANSGVLVYCTDKKNWIPNAIEIQILDDFGSKWKKADPTWRCAAIFGCLAAKKATVKKPGQWNHMTVVCNGKNITVSLNGEVVTELDMLKWTSATTNPDGSKIPDWLSKKPMSQRPTKGYIGLQGKHAGASIFFRNVKIKTAE